MPRETDDLLLESVATHRRRLRQAFLHGELEHRRRVNDNVKRFIGSIVLAAVVGVGCLGYAFVTTIMAKSSTSTSTTNAPVSVSPTTAPANPADIRETP